MCHQAWLIFVFWVETGFYHVSQADLELLASSDLPTLTSQSAGITGVSPRAGLYFKNKIIYCIAIELFEFFIHVLAFIFYQMFSLQVFPHFCRLSLHSVVCPVEAFQFDVIPLVYFGLRCLCFRQHFSSEQGSSQGV